MTYCYRAIHYSRQAAYTCTLLNRCDQTGYLHRQVVHSAVSGISHLLTWVMWCLVRLQNCQGYIDKLLLLLQEVMPWKAAGFSFHQLQPLVQWMVPSLNKSWSNTNIDMINSISFLAKFTVTQIFYISLHVPCAAMSDVSFILSQECTSSLYRGYSPSII